MRTYCRIRIQTSICFLWPDFTISCLSSILSSFSHWLIWFVNMFTFDASDTLLATTLLLLAYAVCLSIWRLCLSPLAKFPGPKVAALTLWYECYYDVLKPGGGLYIWKIEEMHRKYGNTLHCHLDMLNTSLLKNLFAISHTFISAGCKHPTHGRRIQD